MQNQFSVPKYCAKLRKVKTTHFWDIKMKCMKQKVPLCVQTRNQELSNHHDSCESNEGTTEKICEKEKLFKCFKCGIKFNQDASLAKHMLFHSEDMPSHCEKYNVRFVGRGKTSNVTVNSCADNQLCNPDTEKPSTDSAERPLRHCFKTQTCQVSEEPYMCKLCDKIFSQKSGLRKHMSVHNNPELYKCEKCSKTFSQKWNLNQHLLTHSGNRPHECNVCNKGFTLKGDLKKHMRVHTGEQPYKCNDCNKRFSQNGSLLKHSRVHTGERLYKCNECGKAFTQKCHLNQHIYLHRGYRPHKCDKCQKSFSTKGDLQKHTLVHTGERPHRCNICGKAFAQKGKLTRHTLVHTGARPYLCNICGRMFSQNSNLVQHMLIHQSVGAIHKCLVCGKSFSQKGALTKHMIFHKQNQAYKCRECEKVFSQKAVLILHMKSHFKVHANKTVKKEVAFCNRDSAIAEKHIDTPFVIGEEPVSHVLSHSVDQTSNFKHAAFLPEGKCVVQENVDSFELQSNISIDNDNTISLEPNIIKEIIIHDDNHHTVYDASDNGMCTYPCTMYIAPGNINHQAVITESSVFLGDSYSLHGKIDNVQAASTNQNTCSNDPEITIDNESFLSESTSLPHNISQSRNSECDSVGTQSDISTPVSVYGENITNLDQDTNIQVDSLTENIRSEAGSDIPPEKIIHTESVYHVCPVCNKLLASEVDMEQHICSHTDNWPLHKCDKCGREFSQKGKLNRHMLVHSGERPHTCSECGKGFAQRGNLMKHMNIHTGVRSHKCQDCGKMFSQKSDLTKHTFVHTQLRLHDCNVCGKKFSFRAKLKRHMLTHMENRHYPCEFCGKNFSQKNTLSEHRKIHTGSQPHKCNECGKIFSLKGNLKKHSLLHFGSKPFACKECGKLFSQKGNLKKHLLIHSGERPYVCKECGKAFSVKAKLKTHFFVHRAGPHSKYL